MWLRVLYLAMSPDGQSIVTGAGDESLRYERTVFTTNGVYLSIIPSIFQLVYKPRPVSDSWFAVVPLSTILHDCFPNAPPSLYSVPLGQPCFRWSTVSIIHIPIFFSNYLTFVCAPHLQILEYFPLSKKFFGDEGRTKSSSPDRLWHTVMTKEWE